MKAVIAVALLTNSIMAVGQCTLISGRVTTANGVVLACNTSTQPPPVLEITSTTLPTASVGSQYTANLSVSGGLPPLRGNVTSGALPSGITLTGTTLSGTPTAAGTASFTVQICDSTTPTPVCVTGNFTLLTTGSTISIPPGQVCGSGFTSATYTCTVNSSGGSAPFGWSVSSGGLPPGLVLTSPTQSINITGTPITAGVYPFTLTVSSGTQQATSNFSITISTPGTCGFPTYGCARSDFCAGFSCPNGIYDANTVIPPSAGPLTCVAGTTATGLMSCNNSFGLNQIITEPAYNNAQIVRITDMGDTSGANSCGAAHTVGPGGDAGKNVFSSDSNYVFIICIGGVSRIKWFNPVTMQVNTSLNQQGQVITSTGAPFQLQSTSGRFSHHVPGFFYAWSGSQVVTYQITNGVIGAVSAPILDYQFGVPCWEVVAVPTANCPDWTSGTYSRNGWNIIPRASNAASPHIFQLLPCAAAGMTCTPGPSCTTGSSEPNFASAANVSKPGAHVVINDGTCQWADMWTPPGLPGGKISTTAGAAQDRTDTVFVQGFSTDGGGQNSGCFIVVYNSTTNQYQHWNTCTGNTYTATCNGGTGYACVGGTFVFAYTGNTITDNPGLNKPLNGVGIHNFEMGLFGKWGELTFDNCILVDQTYITSPTVTNANQVLCPTYKSGTIAPQADTYHWTFGSSTLMTASTFTGTGTVGHTFNGNNVWVYRNTSYGIGANFIGMDVTQPPTQTKRPFWDQSQTTPPGPCTPNSCWQARNGTTTAFITTFNFDEHGSWRSNPGTDNTPICTLPYDRHTAHNMSSGSLIANSNLWPPIWPWAGEIICFATDGSNKITRQAYVYNTEGSTTLFNLQSNIASFSSDGQWAAFASDWFCTLGKQPTSTAPMLCGFPYQENHAYNAGEYVVCSIINATCQGNVYLVTSAGISGGPVANGTWTACVTTGCVVTSGTASFSWQGKGNPFASVFLVKLQ